jgi:hypothetical protein
LEIVDIFYGHLGYFAGIWIFYDHLVHFVFIWDIFSGYGIMYLPRKIMQPCKGPIKKIPVIPVNKVMTRKEQLEKGGLRRRTYPPYIDVLRPVFYLTPI